MTFQTQLRELYAMVSCSQLHEVESACDLTESSCSIVSLKSYESCYLQSSHPQNPEISSQQNAFSLTNLYDTNSQVKIGAPIDVLLSEDEINQLSSELNPILYFTKRRMSLNSYHQQQYTANLLKVRQDYEKLIFEDNESS